MVCIPKPPNGVAGGKEQVFFQDGRVVAMLEDGARASYRRPAGQFRGTN